MVVLVNPILSACSLGQDSNSLPSPISAESFHAVPAHSNDSFIPPMTSLESILDGFESHPDRCFLSKGGAAFPERAFWSPSNVKLVNPREYLRVTSLDDDRPGSFFYTQRPNIFNIPVEDEWDWYNLINTDRPDFTDTPFSVGEGIEVDPVV